MNGSHGSEVSLADEVAPGAPWRQRPRRLLLATWNALEDYSVIGVLAILVVFFGLTAPGFFSLPSWLATATAIPEILLLALGETLVIVTAGIDLSVGAVLGFSGMTSALVMQALVNAGEGTSLTILAGLGTAVVIGTAWGVLNGLLITKIGVAPFVATLATLGMATGGTFIISGGATITALPGQLSQWVNTAVLGAFPIMFLLSVVASIGMAVLLSQTRFGLRSYAIGSSPRAARVAGFNIDRHLVVVYGISGLLAGFAGILVAARFATDTPFNGANDELDAIAAVIVGGASLFGGRGTVFGTFVGTLIISIIPSGLIIMGLPAYWQIVGVGAIIILAVLLDELRHRNRFLA